MKNKTSKLAIALLAVFCLTVMVFVGGMETKAADNTYVTETYSVADAKPYFTGDTAPDCKTEGYIFAGWYAESDTIETDSETGIGNFVGNPLRTVTGYTGTNVTALFVDEAVLGVKGQIAIMDGDDDTMKATPDDENVNIRFVTSVDTLKYQSVGVEVSYSYNGTKKNHDQASNKVYKQITIADGTDGTADETMSPSQVFSARSKYFKAYTMTKIPMDAFDTALSVRAYWETIDGARVYGNTTPVVKTVQQGIYHTYEAGVDGTYYKVLETAVGTVGDTDTKTVTLYKNAEVESDMEITGNVTISNREGANITLYRAAGLTDANVFSVAADTDAVLNIVGTTDMNSIVLDGRTAEGVEVSGEPLVHSDGGTLFVKNTTLKNTKCTTQSGAIYAQGGTMTVDNSKFIENTGKNGGAIRTSATTTITKCLFGEEGKGNVATADGGAIYSQSKDMEVVDTQFLYNTASRSGAFYNNAGILVVKNSKFANNTVTGAGGAIYQASSSAQMTLTAQNDEGDSTLAIFENNSSASKDANYGGGAICMGNGTFSITGYTFSGNYAANLGGAICIRYNYGTIEDVTFSNNYTTGANGYGGALCVLYNAKSSIIDVTFTGNYTEGTNAHGGALYLAAKAAATTVTNPTYTDNVVKGEGAEGADVYIAE